jgi:hypothetical protein
MDSLLAAFVTITYPSRVANWVLLIMVDPDTEGPMRSCVCCYTHECYIHTDVLLDCFSSQWLSHDGYLE